MKTSVAGNLLYFPSCFSYFSKLKHKAQRPFHYISSLRIFFFLLFKESSFLWLCFGSEKPSLVVSRDIHNSKKSDSTKVLKLHQNFTIFSLGNIQEEAWQTQNKGLSYYRMIYKFNFTTL